MQLGEFEGMKIENKSNLIMIKLQKLEAVLNLEFDARPCA